MEQSKTKSEKDRDIVTMEYAREKLGKKAKNMTDKQVEELLSTLRALCSRAINTVIERITA